MTATAEQQAPTPAGWIRLTPVAMWAAPSAAAGYVLAFNPTDQVADPTGPCLWHAMFGIDGPGCGGTRMFWYLLHGNLVQAVRHHLAALVGLLYGGYALIVWTADWIFGWRRPMWRPSRRAWLVYAVAFGVYAVVLRNLPLPPFNWFYVPDLT